MGGQRESDRESKREREWLEREINEEGSRKSKVGVIHLSSFLRGDFSAGLIQTVAL
jgi:hypothetical protein